MTTNTQSIEVLKNVAHLEATYISNANDETPVFFYKGSPEQWSLNYGQMRQIWATRNFSVTAKSSREDRGLFNIGPMKKWFYSHSLFEKAEDLQEALSELIQFSLTGKARVVVG